MKQKERKKGKIMIAGLIISIAALGFCLNKGIAGAVIFTWGLGTILVLKETLYTGVAGFYKRIEDIMAVLVENVAGAVLVGSAAGLANNLVKESCVGIAQARLQNPVWSFLGAIGCGFIITTVVLAWRRGAVIPLLFGVPLFILAGLPHSIADAFYFSASGILEPQVFCVWCAEVVGNFIGCNLLWKKTRS